MQPASVRINASDRFLAPVAAPAGRRLPATRILGTPVSLLTMTMAVEHIVTWARERRSSMVCVRDVHSIMRAAEDPHLLAVHERAAMVTPDGMPLAITSRWRGHGTGRVSGPSLVEEVCNATKGTGLSHYFYGGKEGVAALMVNNLRQRYPGLAVAGIESPPFGEISADEDVATVARILASGAAIVWVGISTPKQDFWMDDHRDRLPGVVMIGVGAAFDFHAGIVKRAPRWMQNSGLEWLHRLGSEPRRLWRRYVLLAPKFVWLLGRGHDPRQDHASS